MSNDINLAIKKRRETRFVSAKQVKKLRLAAGVSLFLVAILSSGLFLIIASSPLQKLRDQEKQVGSELDAMQDTSGRILLVKAQLTDISQLLAKRPDLRHLIDTVSQMIPAGVSMSTISMDETQISMSLSTSSLAALNTFFTTVAEKANAGEVPPTVETSPITFDAATGTYTLDASFSE